jgi:hypothetical protein
MLLQDFGRKNLKEENSEDLGVEKGKEGNTP